MYLLRIRMTDIYAYCLMPPACMYVYGWLVVGVFVLIDGIPNVCTCNCVRICVILDENVEIYGWLHNMNVRTARTK